MLSAPSPHKDIDLIHFAANFDHVDTILILHADLFQEISKKRLSHKRAFLFRGVLIELFLVTRNAQGTYITRFYNKVPFMWPSDLFAYRCVLPPHSIPVATKQALDRYRDSYESVHINSGGERTNHVSSTDSSV